MTIGQFAQLTGLGTKALRLYDEQGVLVPAFVDPYSRYRRYTAAQLHTALRLKALRAAGIGVPDAARALGDRRPAEEVVSEFRARLAIERERQDAALAALESLLGGAEHHWHIERRHAIAQHWAGVVLPVPDDEDGDEQAEEAFGTLWTALATGDNAPIGPLWTSMRPAEDGNTVELLCCWPIAHPPPPGWSVPGHTIETGRLPEGPELVVRWRHDDPVPVIDGATHPAVIALLAGAEERGLELDVSRLRQIGVFEDGHPVGMEVVVPVLDRLVNYS